MHLLEQITDSTPFHVLDMAFHIWLMGHLIHHVVAFVPGPHRHIRNWFANRKDGMAIPHSHDH
jgi:hypothetical protein